MTKRMALTLMAGMFLGCTVLAAVADEFEAIEKKLQAGWEKQKSITAKMQMTSHMEMGTAVMDGKGDGSFEYLRQGEKVFSRLEMNNAMTQKMGDQETKTQQTVLTIIDGEYAYTLTDMMGQKMAMKTNIDPKMTNNPGAMFEEFRQNYELKLLPEETLDGQKTFVIEATPKDKAQNPMMSRMVFYFLQDTGFMVKIVAYGVDGKPVQTVLYTDIKFNVDIAPNRFVFKAPEGVQIMDQTGKTPQPSGAKP